MGVIRLVLRKAKAFDRVIDPETGILQALVELGGFEIAAVMIGRDFFACAVARSAAFDAQGAGAIRQQFRRAFDQNRFCGLVDRMKKEASIDEQWAFAITQICSEFVPQIALLDITDYKTRSLTDARAAMFDGGFGPIDPDNLLSDTREKGTIAAIATAGVEHSCTVGKLVRDEYRKL